MKLVKAREAAEIAGRAQRNIYKWIELGYITEHRSETGKVLVDLQELLEATQFVSQGFRADLAYENALEGHWEAQMRGIDLKQLEKERPTNPEQIKKRQLHEARANSKPAPEYVAVGRQPKPKRQQPSPRAYKFTQDQMRIAMAAIERNKK